MAGHSKWSKIKHGKAISDAKKGKIFSKLAQQITLAARQGGGDPDANPSLRLLVDKARSQAMSSDNVERAIARGTGEGNDAKALEEASYEGFGPGGVSIIVDVVTDSKNRVVADLRKMFSDSGGSLGETGSVSWNFELKGLVTMRTAKTKKAEKFGQPDEVVDQDPEETMMDVMEVDGVLDLEETEVEDTKALDVYTLPQDLAKVRDAIMAKGYIVKSAELVKISKMYKDISGESLESAKTFIDQLDDYDDVQNVWTDINPEN